MFYLHYYKASWTFNLIISSDWMNLWSVPSNFCTLSRDLKEKKERRRCYNIDIMIFRQEKEDGDL